MPTNPRVLLVVNPISGGKDKKPILDHLTKTLKMRNFEGAIYRTTGRGDKEKLAETLAHDRPDRIIIIGGDGTLKLLAEVIGKEDIPLALIPAGSANGLAENLNLPDRIQDLTEIALGDRFALLDTIQVNGELCLHISDIGLNAALIKNYEEGNIRGKLGYLIQSLPTLIKSNFPFKFRIDTGTEQIEREAVLLGIANAKKYGTGSIINPGGKYDDGIFEILVFKEFNIPEILKTFREGSRPDKEFLEILSATQIRVTAEKKVPFQIDGEYRGEVTEVIAHLAPEKIKIAVPPEKSSKKS